MVSFRDAAKKKVPRNGVVDMADLAQQLGLSRPVSLHTLINKLNASPYDFVMFDPGPLGPSTTTGEAQVIMTLDGFVSFTGKITESGAIGHVYDFAMTVDNYHPEFGQPKVFRHRDSVAGTINRFASHEDSWQENNHDVYVSENWESIKTSSSRANLKVGTSVDEIADDVLVGLGIAAVIGTVDYFLGKPDVHCTWVTDETGAQHYICTKGEQPSGSDVPTPGGSPPPSPGEPPPF